MAFHCKRYNKLQQIFVFGSCYANDVKNKIKKNKFWIDVLRAYSDVFQLSSENNENYTLSSLIFYNKTIRIGSKPIFIKEWDQKGVKNINDLVHENGDFFTQDEFEISI